MAERITAKRCQNYLQHLGKVGGFPTSSRWKKIAHGTVPIKSYFRIEVAYGRPRLVFVIGGSGGEADVSPRLPASQMLMWLDAAGPAGLKARYKELMKRYPRGHKYL